MHIPELLSPAGSFESFKAAVNNGADAVYFGGRDFNARAGAENFSDAELKEAIDYAHLRGVKANITINTLYKMESPDDSEIFRAMVFAEKMYEAGADALILTDLGLFSLIRQQMPNINLHASTQMTVHSLAGAKYLKELGFDRVVLSRELSLVEIREIALKSGVEIEVFVHGALCVSYSGQCLMSSFLGGRSGNRGKCAQPCRQYYKLLGTKKRATGYLLSPRDIMTLENLNEIVDSGVRSLKIEGRMKSPEYVAVVTRAYREQLERVVEGLYSNSVRHMHFYSVENALNPAIFALQKCKSHMELLYNVPESLKKDVTQIFNRGGESSNGYFYNYSGARMMSTQTPKSTGTYLGTVASVSKNEYKNGKKKLLIKIEDKVVPGDGVEIWARAGHTGGYINEAADAGSIVSVYAAGTVKAGDAVYKSFNKELNDRAKAMVSADTRKIHLKLKLKAKISQPLEMTLIRDSVEAVAYGPIVEPSKNQPLSAERILEQLCKMGGTPFDIEKDSIDMNVEEGIYIPLSVLNNLRRDCLSQFSESYVSSFHRGRVESNTDDYKPLFNSKPSAQARVRECQKLCVQVVSKEQLSAACDEGIEKAYFTIKGYDPKKPVEIANDYTHKTALYIALPKIMRPFEENKCKELIKALEKTNIKGYLASTYGQLSLLGELSDKDIIADYSFNILNPVSYEQLKRLGLREITLSTELSLKELGAFSGGEVIVYGNLPLMISVQCPVGLYGAKAKGDKFCPLKNNSAGYMLSDNKNELFPIYTDCESCLAFVLNGHKLNMQEKLNSFCLTNLEWLRLLFYTEDETQVKSVIKAFRDDEEADGKITYGHFFKSVL